MTPSRRLVLAGLATLAHGPASAGLPTRIVALEWSIVSMLLSIGIVPVGIGETDGYRAWVGSPALPAGVSDVGIRNEPNLEALSALRPDLILVSPLSRAISPLLEAVAPVREITLYDAERAPLRRARRALTELGAELGREAAAIAAIARSEEVFSAARARLASGPRPPLVVLSFLDARHARVFGPGSLFGDVVERLGLVNGWRSAANDWGYALVGIEALALLPDAALVVVEPVPPDVRLRTTGPSLWTNLPAVRAGRLVTLPPVWQFGDLAAGIRFAGLLADALAGGPHGG